MTTVTGMGERSLFEIRRRVFGCLSPLAMFAAPVAEAYGSRTHRPFGYNGPPDLEAVRRTGFLDASDAAAMPPRNHPSLPSTPRAGLGPARRTGAYRRRWRHCD